MTPALHGGLRLPGNKQRSTQKPLRLIPAPDQVVLPLDQHAGAPAVATVRVGDRVLRGQLIARAESEISASLHASVAGTVLAIEPRAVPYHRNGPSTCIVIDNDGSDATASVAAVDHAALDPRALCEYIGNGGIVGLGGAAFPTAPKLRRGQQNDGPHLILNGAECEPWISCDDMLMREHAQQILRGAIILCHALQAARCTVVIEDDKPVAESAMRAAQAELHDERIVIQSVPTIYPAGGENQIITVVTGLEVPASGLPSDIGVLCHNVGTAAAVARWLDNGEPLIRRIVTVTGSGVTEPGNLEVWLGTPMSQLVDHSGGYSGSIARLLMGGSMMGLALPSDDLPVVKASNCLVAALPADLHLRGMEMPCIRCGNCSEACPVMLLPQQLHWFARSNDFAALESLGLMDCIECGCCDYVCPSQIPLAQQFRQAKPALVERLTSKQQASLARQRYESRDQRLERIEAERQAKLAEKRKAMTQNNHPGG
jgi:electron transport complex protein RnfC